MNPNIYKGQIPNNSMTKEADKFIEYCGITARDSSLRKIKSKLDIINYFYKEKTDKLKLEDIHKFLSWVNKSNYAKSTKNDIIKIFKRFLKWKYKDWNTRFNELKDAKLNGNDGRQLDKEDLLTPDEMNLIISSTDSIKYKTILLLLQETACRPEEILRNLKWKNINWNKGEVKLYSNKTDKTRFIPVKNSKGHLQRYKVECFPTPPRAEEMVFGLSNQALSDHLNKIEKELKLTKHLYPYLWRHSVLSNMIKKLSPKVYEMFAGHSLETGMKIYAHLDTEDLREELNEKMYHIEELTPEEKEEVMKLKKEIERQDKILKFCVEAINMIISGKKPLKFVKGKIHYP
ncbi:Tyrosine recombinase XerC [subsurface metagenome]